MKKLILCMAIISTFLSCANSQPTPKKEVEARINKWYAAHPDKYSLTIGTDAIASIEGYHPDTKDEPSNLIRVRWKGMLITMAFKMNVKDIPWNKASLQEQFSYIVLDNIYDDIEVNAWDIAPRTPQSSSEKGVNFTLVENGQLSFTVDWEIYTVFGYSQTEDCKEALNIMDAPTPEPCYVGVDKRLPLHLDVYNLVLNF